MYQFSISHDCIFLTASEIALNIFVFFLYDFTDWDIRNRHHIKLGISELYQISYPATHTVDIQRSVTKLIHEQHFLLALHLLR
jgi:hypothetical protein